MYFQHFQCQNIYFQKVPAPAPSESNGRPLIVLIILIKALTIKAYDRRLSGDGS